MLAEHTSFLTLFWPSHAGRAALAWEQNVFNAMCESAFGYYALNLGSDPTVLNPMQRCTVQHILHVGSDVQFDPLEWPFQNDALDYIAMPHVLEFSSNPHAVLREAARCLRPGGAISLTAFNPRSLLALRSGAAGLGHSKAWIARSRLLDWMRLLDLHPDHGAFGQWRPPCDSAVQFARLAWLDEAGERWWPQAANVYALRVVKRVLPDIRRPNLHKRRAFAKPTLHPISNRENNRLDMND